MEEYRPYAKTVRQQQILEALIKCGTNQKAADELGIHVRNVQRAVEKIKAAALAKGDLPLSSTAEHRLVTQVRQLKEENKLLRKQYAETSNITELLNQSKPKVVTAAKIKRGGKKHVVAATAFLSDTHFDELINIEETGGVNEYDRQIAEKRLLKFAEKTVVVAKDLMNGFETPHLDLPFGGDMLSGSIHEELARTNVAETGDTVNHWSEKLSEMIITLSKEFKSIFIPCVAGNHGRNTRKPRHKGRAMDNFDWMIYQFCKKQVMQSAKNVTFYIPTNTDARWETMGHTYLMTHGDQASGGTGWGGIFSPIMRLNDKKIKAYQARGLHFDYLIMGHWHQFIDAGAVLVNGTMKGWDEFAHNLNFRPEPPQQAFWLTDGEKGKIFSGPLFVAEHEQKQKQVLRKSA